MVGLVVVLCKWWKIVLLIIFLGVNFLVGWYLKVKWFFLLFIRCVFFLWIVLLMRKWGVFGLIKVVGWNWKNFKFCKIVLVCYVIVILFFVFILGLVVWVNIWLFLFVVKIIIEDFNYWILFLWRRLIFWIWVFCVVNYKFNVIVWEIIWIFGCFWVLIMSVLIIVLFVVFVEWSIWGWEWVVSRVIVSFFFLWLKVIFIFIKWAIVLAVLFIINFIVFWLYKFIFVLRVFFRCKMGLFVGLMVVVIFFWV